MAETQARVTEPEAAALLPPREVDLRRAVRVGLIAGIVMVFVGANGMLVAFDSRRLVGSLTLATVLLVGIPAIGGAISGAAPPQLEGFAATVSGVRNVVGGLLGGLAAGVVAAAFLLFVDAVNVRSIFVNVSPELVDKLSFGSGTLTGAGILVLVSAVAGATGGASHLLDGRIRRALVAALTWLLALGMLEPIVSQVLRSLRLFDLRDWLYTPAASLGLVPTAAVFLLAGALTLALQRRPIAPRQRLERLPQTERRRVVTVILVVAIGILAVTPFVLGRFLSEVADQAMIFLLMALGLNIVVGYAGLLDLGYVAFFAVGAYTTGVLTSPLSPGFAPELTFFMAIPFVILAAAVAGLLVGTPVLRMRGDYLAIVTLGFGEIARLIALSDWQKGTLGGAQGIIQIPDISVIGYEIRVPETFFLAISAFILLAIYVAYALQDSRMGRAWMAMREDESVAEAMGVNIVAAKLWAFVIGAILASFGGALFATKIGSIFPNSFDIVTSITILVIVIFGGIGSVPGVAVGAIVLVGLPELLREFELYRFLIYGALLIYMMLNRPEGLIPSRRRAQELREEEVLQDAWLRAERGDGLETEGVPGAAGSEP
jgi:branched-chain amino acid transport system permease protein